MGKYLGSYCLLNFLHLSIFYRKKTRVQFLQREEKKVKGTNVTKMQKKYTKNENFLTIFFIEGTLMRASRRPTIRPAHIC